MKIAYADDIFETSNTTIDIWLKEDGWYHVPQTVKDIVTRMRRTEYRGDPVNRVQFMSLLSDIRSILLRGTFHTDQAESVFEGAALYEGGNELFETSASNFVEKCECPPGYEGLSCEKCSFGHMRIYENSTNHQTIGKCISCNCNGHAESCDLDLGTCGKCHHNTFGEKCERCMAGYYGNALVGTPNDCLRCACPLAESSNNFSPNCQLKSSDR